MTSTELLLVQTRMLSELELDDFLKGIGEHLHKNNLEHLIDNAFDMEGGADRIAELEDDLEMAKDKIERLERQIEGLSEITGI